VENAFTAVVSSSFPHAVDNALSVAVAAVKNGQKMQSARFARKFHNDK